MPPEIRPMTISDYGEVLALWQSMEGLLLGEADAEHAIARYLARNPGISHVAVSEDRIIGAALCGHDGRRGLLHHLAVSPAFRRQGVGRAIVSACRRALHEQGIGRCNIFVLDGNDAGREFWRRDGWYDWPDIRLMSRDWQSGTPGARS